MTGVLAGSLLPLCEQAVALARTAGADEAEAFAEQSRTVKARAEQNDLAGADVDESMAIGLRVLVRGAVGFVALNRADEASLQEAARTAVALARAGTPEDGPALAPPTPIPSVEGLYDAAVASASVELAVERCHALLEALQKDARVRVDGCEVDFSVERHAIFSSRGVKAEELGSGASQSAFGFAAEGDDVSSFDSEVDASIGIGGLIGTRMADALSERLLKLLGSVAYDGPEDGKVILAPDAFMEILLAPLFDSLDGEAVRLGRSRLADQLGKQVAAKLLTIIDDPLAAGEVGSEAFDREGMGHRTWRLIDGGVATTFLHNFDSARRLGQAPTGHAGGGARSLPGIDVTRILVEPGPASLEELIREAGEGVYVGRFSGSVDEVSGDFSGVAKCSFRIRGGRLAEPVKETMVAGNAFEVLEGLVGLSRERKILPGQVLPHALCTGMSISGGG